MSWKHWKEEHSEKAQDEAAGLSAPLSMREVKAKRAVKFKSDDLDSDNGVQEFSTKDLGLAAALHTLGYEVCRIEMADRTKRQGVFIFSEKDNDLKDRVSEYWADTLKVKARKFQESIKMLKSRVSSL